MNNGNASSTLSFDFTQVPGLPPSQQGGATASASAPMTMSCEFYDVWAHRSLGKLSGPRFTTATEVASHDSVFLTLSGCSSDAIVA